MLEEIVLCVGGSLMRYNTNELVVELNLPVRARMPVSPLGSVYCVLVQEEEPAACDSQYRKPEKKAPE